MAELGLAIAGIVGTIDLCFKYGKQLVNLYETFKSAENELNERIVRLQNIWVRTDAQLRFLASVWSTLDTAHQRIQAQTVEILAAKLRLAACRIENVVEQDNKEEFTVQLKVKRWKYTRLKEDIDQAIEELDTWQKTFDPSWFLIMKIADSCIDRELKTTPSDTLNSASSLRKANRSGPSDEALKIFLPADGLELAVDTLIPSSTCRLAQRKGSSKWLLFDNAIPPEGSNPHAAAKNVRDIARKLSRVDPMTFHLLNCYGVIRQIDSESRQVSLYTFVFRVPHGYAEPQSLRAILCDYKADHSLSERFSIAKDLARSASYVHSFGFVHKNIRPETVILLKEHNALTSLGTPFLVGFEVIRAADVLTARRGDAHWYLNIYRHPQRQGINPREDYIMQHDIYSLGVCLLELGLFKSLVITQDSGQTYTPSPVLGLSVEEITKVEPVVLKQLLVTIAARDLPKNMGSKYTSVVITCLTCLDKDNLDFGDENDFLDEDGILVNVRYIEKVLLQLNEVSV